MTGALDLRSRRLQHLDVHGALCGGLVGHALALDEVRDVLHVAQRQHVPAAMLLHETLGRKGATHWP